VTFGQAKGATISVEILTTIFDGLAIWLALNSANIFFREAQGRDVFRAIWWARRGPSRRRMERRRTSGMRAAKGSQLKGLAAHTAQGL
jgi:hypothetical protein